MAISGLGQIEERVHLVRDVLESQLLQILIFTRQVKA